jgi:hypothetical protein
MATSCGWTATGQEMEIKFRIAVISSPLRRPVPRLFA